VLLAPAPADAQGATTCSIDSAANTRAFTILLSLPVPDSLSAGLQSVYQAEALAVAGAFRQPSQVSLPKWPGTYMPSDAPAGTALAPLFGLGGYLSFELNRAGRLKAGRVRATSGSPEIAAALESAVHAADSAGGLPPLSDQAYPQDGRLQFSITESVGPLPAAVVFAQVRLHALLIDAGPVLTQPGAAHYPLTALAHKPIEGRALFQFVIGPDGLPVPTSFVLLETNYSDFADAAYHAILGDRFFPARVGACPVPVLVEQWVRFKNRP
jgi:hypothetical protein